ncbi:MAG: hypothetical protein ACM3ZC_13380 [Bacteroidota bacterium]
MNGQPMCEDMGRAQLESLLAQVVALNDNTPVMVFRQIILDQFNMLVENLREARRNAMKAFDRGVMEGQSKQAIIEIQARDRFLARVRKEEFEPLKAENDSLRVALRDAQERIEELLAALRDKCLDQVHACPELAKRLDAEAAITGAGEVIQMLLEDREHETDCDACSFGDPCEAGMEISRRAVNAARYWMSTDFGQRVQQMRAIVEAARKVVFLARTTGGTAGRDEELCAGLDALEKALAALDGEGNKQ